MKNKKITYFLLVMVIIIWGAITVRIVTHFNPGDGPDGVFMDHSQIKDSTDSSVRFNLILNYRDPFLGGKFTNNNTNMEVQQESKPKPREFSSNRYLVWPDVLYVGLIENKGSKELVALLKINHKDYLMKSGDIVQNYKLEKAFKDSVWLTYNNETRTILKGLKENTINY